MMLKKSKSTKINQILMVIFGNLFIIISISFQTHSFKQYFQNLEPENPRTKIKCCQNEQLKFINTIYNQMNIWNNIQLVKLAREPRNHISIVPPYPYAYLKHQKSKFLGFLHNFGMYIMFHILTHYITKKIYKKNIYIYKFLRHARSMAFGHRWDVGFMKSKTVKVKSFQNYLTYLLPPVTEFSILVGHPIEQCTL